MKPTILQNSSKYARFLILTTLISCFIFFLNVTVGFDHHSLSKLQYQNSYSGIKDDGELLLGDVRAPSGSVALGLGLLDYDIVLNEHTPRFQIAQFWENFAELLIKYSPPLDFKIDKKKPESCKLETNLIDPVYDGELYSEEFLSKCLKLNYNDYNNLINLHQGFINDLPQDYGTRGNEFYEKDGIVMIGGGKYSIMTMLVIQILREHSQTQLPIEVLIPHGERDEFFCNSITKFNAKCISPIVSPKVWKALRLEQYQIKIMSLISSSFENVLYLDSDSYPLKNLDDIFKQPLFLENGFISWPDFWRRSTSPAFYSVAGLKIGKKVRNNIDEFSPLSKFSSGNENSFTQVAFHDRENTIPDGSSETSSIMINKFKHAQTLMLSFYYNLNGPNVYYQLLTQGNFGQGDKETFVAAAHVLKKPYYQLKTKPMVGGDLLFGGKTPRGTSMIQFDFVKDYDLSLRLKEKFGDNDNGEVQEHYDLQKITDFFNDNNKDAMFLHYNLGKMDPLKLQVFNKRRFGYDLKMIGFDFEFRNIELMQSMICNNNKIQFEYLKHSNHDEICENLKRIMQIMGETSDRVVLN